MGEICHRFGLNTKRAGRLRFGFARHNTRPIVVIARAVIIVSSVLGHTEFGAWRRERATRRTLSVEFNVLGRVDGACRRSALSIGGGKTVIGHRRDGKSQRTRSRKSENTREFRRLPILYGFSISYVFRMAWDSSCAGRIKDTRATGRNICSEN